MIFEHRPQRLDEGRARVQHGDAFQLHASGLSQLPELDVHVVQHLDMVRDEADRGDQHVSMAVSVQFPEGGLHIGPQPSFPRSSLTLVREASGHGSQGLAHRVHGPTDFVRVGIVHRQDPLRETVRGEEDRDTSADIGREFLQADRDILGDRPHQPRMPMPALDITDREVAAQGCSRFLHFLDIRPYAHGGVLGRHAQPDQPLREIVQQLGVGVPDRGMPVAESHIAAVPLAARTIELLLELPGHLPRDAEDRRFPASDAIPLPDLFHEIGRSRPSAAHIQKIRLDVVEAVRPSHGHEQDRNRSLSSLHCFTRANS